MLIFYYFYNTFFYRSQLFVRLDKIRCASAHVERELAAVDLYVFRNKLGFTFTEAVHIININRLSIIRLFLYICKTLYLWYNKFIKAMG